MSKSHLPRAFIKTCFLFRYHTLLASLMAKDAPANSQHRMKSLLVGVIIYHHDNEAADIAVFLHQPSKDDQSTRAGGGRRGLCGSHQILLRHRLLSLAFYVKHKREKRHQETRRLKVKWTTFIPSSQSVLHVLLLTPHYSTLLVARSYTTNHIMLILSLNNGIKTDSMSSDESFVV